jgi:hypothetical protein
MKRLFFCLLTALIIALFSCNNSETGDGEPGGSPGAKEDSLLRAQADSLQKEVIDGHDIAMPKSMKIPSMQRQVQQLLDSVSKLPARAQAAAAPYKAGLEKALQDLEEAKMSMDKWMDEFKLDSAASDLQVRVKYLAEEKLKVDRMKEKVLGSMAKADSLLRARF